MTHPTGRYDHVAVSVRESVVELRGTLDVDLALHDQADTRLALIDFDLDGTSDHVVALTSG